MEKTVIEVKNLRKYFGKTKAVDGISFDVVKGEIFGFLGPNGAGKSTTIRCLMDFIRPTSGTVSILGLDSFKDSVEIKKQLGYLPGNVKLYQKWTGNDHISFIESIRGQSKNVQSLIKRLDFDPTKKVKTLSSGNNQKLGLILSLMHNPKVLIMDEPTVALDPLLQNEIYSILDELKKNGTTVFMSSHNLPEVERVCDRAGIIKDGRLVGIENIEELYKKKIRKIEIRFKQKFHKNDFKLKDVEIVQDLPDGLVINVKGDINPLIKSVSKYNISDIEIAHATLEDVFLEFYGKK
ncbi:ABC transporter ATP-binding protein [bacterium]|nr:ABC transporter ATP-binding protein [bacterium]